MRPRGEFRQALVRAVEVAGPSGGATWRGLAQLACVAGDVARDTVRNMHRAGELIVVGQAREPGVNRPQNLYAPAVPQDGGGAEMALDSVVRCWADFR